MKHIFDYTFTILLIALTVAANPLTAGNLQGDADTRSQMAQFWNLAEDRIALENEALRMDLNQNQRSRADKQKDQNTVCRSSLLNRGAAAAKPALIQNKKSLIQARQSGKTRNTRSRMGLQILNIDLIGLVFREQTESTDDSLEGRF